ncbi:MAG: hypothetical protein JST58_05940 [Bacteroidetes bacterium]|nr:hypothetical protein [Bacteroidota bacterium]
MRKAFFMTTKLNLTIEEKTAKQIKAYAQKRKTSVSKIAEEHFNKLLNNKKKTGKSFVEKYGGIIKKDVIGNIEEARDKYLKEKYGL